MPNPLELSSLETTTFNHLSQELTPTISLGSKLAAAFADILSKRATDDTHLGVIDGLLESLAARIASGTPINAIAAGATLTLLGAVSHEEKVTIGTDIYEFLADAAQSKSNESNIAVNIVTKTTKSSGTLTIDTQPLSGDKFTIGEKIYTLVPVGTNTADGEVSIGANLAGAQTAIVAAVNGTDGVNEPHPLVTISAFANNVATITALIGGTSGDTIATTETFTAVSNIFGAVALGSGADCSAADAVTALVTAITASDTQGVSATDGANDTVVLSADIKGTIGNAIVIATDAANGSFGEGNTTLEGGVDGTIGLALSILIDDTNLYICLQENTISGANWKKITLGTL